MIDQIFPFVTVEQNFVFTMLLILSSLSIHLILRLTWSHKSRPSFAVVLIPGSVVLVTILMAILIYCVDLGSKEEILECIAEGSFIGIFSFFVHFVLKSRFNSSFCPEYHG